MNAQVDGYRVAGKTGTARKAVDGGFGYTDGAGNLRHIASFVGFLPADNPEISILVTIDQPTATIFASQAAAPAFADIANFAVRHLRIAPPAQPGGPGVEVYVPGINERIQGEVAVDPDAQAVEATPPAALPELDDGQVDLLPAVPAVPEPEPEPAPVCLLYTSPSPRDATLSRMPSSA